MNSKNNPSEEPAELRRRAEESIREKTSNLPEDLSALSPEETRRMLHELRVHKIELEMQNEELRQAHLELDASRARYFDLYDLAPVGYITISEKGLILEANLTAARLIGVPRGSLIKQPITSFIHKEDQDFYYLHRKKLLETLYPQEYELRVTKPDGTSFWAHLTATAAQDADGATVCRVVMHDITERKSRENEHELMARLILLVNTSGDFRECLSALMSSLQQWSGCEAVGIRLHSGDDYPYYETRGFPAAFVQAESRLCAYGPDGKPVCDGAGNPVLECMCGNILSGRFDPAKPFFTAHGSFWSNNTTALLACTTEADRQARTRNRCNGEGYESVALIPLRTGQQVFGLLQFNDHRPDRFTPDLIALMERMADSLASFISRHQAEAALRESQAQLREAHRLAQIGIWNWIADTDTVTWTEELYHIAGLAPMLPAPTYADHHTIYAPESWARLKEAAEKALETGAPYQLELELIRPDGTTRWVNTFGGAIYDDHGRVKGLHGTVQDITEQKKAKETLAISENKYRKITEKIPGMVYQYVQHLDGSFSVPFVSARVQEYSGYKPEEIITNPALFFQPIHPDDRDHIQREIEKSAKNLSDFSVEHRLLNADGEIKWFQVKSTPYLLDNGDLCWEGISTDITQSKKADEALRESEEKYRSLFENAEDGIFVADPETGILIDVNQAAEKLTGYSKKELIGKPQTFIHPSGESDFYREEFRKATLGKGAKFSEMRVRTREGQNVPVEISSGGTISLENKKLHIGIFRDITERKQAEEEKTKLEERLQQAQKLESIGTLAGGIAHDFNNILYPLLGFAELLKEDLPKDSPLQEHIDEILRATMRLKDLVKQILAFSRKGDQNTKPVRLHHIIKEALKLLRSSIPTTIDIEQDIDPNCGIVMADLTQIHQIVMNLATNAYHAMEDTGGKLKVSLKQIDLAFEPDISIVQALTTGKYALLTVTDTGIGIEKAISGKIFDPYFTTKGVGKGTGLGLSVVHGIVKAHKGDIRIDSVPGKGTNVRVYLPIMELTTENKGIDNSEPLSGGTEKILLVDDEPPIVRVEQQMLQKLGYHVTTRTSSREALTTFKADPAAFDLVLTDMTMPKMNGIQLVEKLISIRPDIPIILCTGYSEKIGEETEKPMGVNGFLMKPVDNSDMAKMVRKVLDTAKA